MLRARLLTAAVFIPILLLLILYPLHLPLAIFIFCAGTIGLTEYTGIVFARQLPEKVLTVALGAIVLGAALFGPPECLSAALALAVIAAMLWVLFTRPDFEMGLRDAGLVLLGILYLSFLLPHFAKLKNLPPNGPYWVIFVIAIGMLGDTFGYFVGRSIGRHKLSPHVSPGKTVEGAAGILLGSLIAGILCRFILLRDTPLQEIIVLSLILGVLGQLGDLSESVIKRAFTVKESGWIFPGHGGVLDRIDSLLFPVAFLYYHLLWLH